MRDMALKHDCIVTLVERTPLVRSRYPLTTLTKLTTRIQRTYSGASKWIAFNPTQNVLGRFLLLV